MYPRIDDPNFEQKISNKAEFRIALDLGHLKPHQELIRRYMSPYTPYDKILLYHSMGSGKSYIAISIAEDHYNMYRRKCIVLTKGTTSSINYKLQIISWLKTNNPDITQKEIKEYITNRYIIDHYLSFCKRKLIGVINPDICDNVILVIDEVHNINYGMDNIYGLLRSYIKSLTNSKVLLLSGTPMVNDLSRISSIAEMILPCITNDIMIKNEEMFYKKIIGYTSCHEIDEDDVVIRYMGIKLSDSFPLVYITNMIDIQKSVYQNRMYNDSIYVNQTHISLFVFSDGTYGKEAYSTKIIQHKFTVPCFVGAFMKDRKYNYSCLKFNICNEFINDIGSKNLIKHSCKYHSIITEIKNRVNELCFIYCKDIVGSGLIILSCILESIGYELYYGQCLETINPKMRYTICVGKTSISPNNKDRIAGFNNYLNRHGEYVKIMLGSAVTGECISLLNVRHVHCLSPHWNISSMNQVIRRVIRTDSHNMLDKQDRTIDVFIHVSVIDNVIVTVDMRKINISESKEIELEPVRNTIRLSSIESIINKYPCNILNLDCSTFTNYINDKILNKYIKDISNCIVPMITIDYIMTKLSIPLIITKYVLNHMIQYNIPVRDYYGRLSYVREAHGIITLTRSPNANKITIDTTSDKLFYKTCYNIDDYIDYKKIISEIENLHPLEIIKEMSKLKWEDKIRVLELSIICGSKICIPYNLYIIKHYTYYHVYEYKKPIKGNYNSSSRGLKQLGLTRVYINGTWKYATYDTETVILLLYKEKINTIEKSNVDVLYLYSTIDLILRVSINDDKIKDRRIIKRGRIIESLSKEELYTCYYDIFKSYPHNMYKQDLIKIIVDGIVNLNKLIYI